MQQVRNYFGDKQSTLLLLSLLLTAIVIPFQRPVIPVWPGIVLMTAAWLFTGNLKDKILAFFSNGNAAIFATLYLFYCCGYFYSSNTAYAKTDLILKIPLLLFPLAIGSSALKGKTEVILKTYLLAVLVSSVVCVVRSGYLTYTTGENHFYYYKLSWFFHVGHYAMYLVFAACVALYFLFKAENKNIKICYLLVFLFLTVVIILLSARAQIVAFFIVIVYTGFYYLFNNQNKIQGIGIIGLLIITITLLFYFIPATHKRFNSVNNELNQFYSNKNTGSYASFLRLAIWRTGVEIIREHPFSGVGTGDAKDELIKKAQEKNYSIIVKRNLNYHNQFLQTWAAIGLPGFFALLFSIIIGTLYSLKKKYFLATSFFIIITISFFTESMLERQAGVIFYSFFSAILIFADNE
ncbi:MAG: hypothetical protein POELPBGB_01276 [Bacteroidia bacterium]|nr:hypothetical protein [Bacteroidia bacterium]